MWSNKTPAKDLVEEVERTLENLSPDNRPKVHIWTTRDIGKSLCIFKPQNKWRKQCQKIVDNKFFELFMVHLTSQSNPHPPLAAVQDWMRGTCRAHAYFPERNVTWNRKPEMLRAKVRMRCEGKILPWHKEMWVNMLCPRAGAAVVNIIVRMNVRTISGGTMRF